MTILSLASGQERPTKLPNSGDHKVARKEVVACAQVRIIIPARNNKVNPIFSNGVNKIATNPDSISQKTNNIKTVSK